MNINKFTQNSMLAVQGCEKVADEYGNQEIDQVKEGYEYYRIFCGDAFAGYAGIRPEEDALFLSKLYLHKDYRGQHLSTKALEFLKDYCHKHGLTKIWLTCNKYNSHTLDVYHHLGFSNVRSQVADIGNGYVMDDYILELEV